MNIIGKKVKFFEYIGNGIINLYKITFDDDTFLSWSYEDGEGVTTYNANELIP